MSKWYDEPSIRMKRAEMGCFEREREKRNRWWNYKMYACLGILSLAGVDAETKYGIGDDEPYVYFDIAREKSGYTLSSLTRLCATLYEYEVGWMRSFKWYRNNALRTDTYINVVWCGNANRECEHIWIWILMVIELEWWRSTLLPLINGNVDSQDSLSEIVKNEVCFFFLLADCSNENEARGKLYVYYTNTYILLCGHGVSP